MFQMLSQFARAVHSTLQRTTPCSTPHSTPHTSTRTLLSIDISSDVAFRESRAQHTSTHCNTRCNTRCNTHCNTHFNTHLVIHRHLLEVWSQFLLAVRKVAACRILRYVSSVKRDPRIWKENSKRDVQDGENP